MSHFPMLKMPDLITILSTFNIHLQQDDITKPKPLVVQNTIQALMYLITGKQIPQLEDTLQMITIYKQSQRIIKLFVPEYSFNDLLKPESSKFRKMLCGCIHFIKLKLDLQQGMEDNERHVEGLARNKDKFAQDKIQLQQQLHHSKKEKEAEQVDIQKYSKQNTELNGKLKEMRKQQSRIMSHLQKQKSLKTKLTDDHCSIEFKILSASESIDTINSRRIDDMDSFLNELDKLKFKVQELKSKSVGHDQQYVHLHNRYNMLQDIHRYFEQLNGLLEECNHLVTQNKQSSLECAQLNQTLHDKQIERKTRDIKLQQLNRQHNSIKERTLKLTEQIKEKQRIGNSKLNQLQSQLSSMQNGETDESRELSQLELKTHELRTLNTQLERKIESEQSDLEYSLRELKEVVVNYMSCVQKEL